MKLDELNILDIGNTIGISGIVLSGNGDTYFALFPDQEVASEFNTLELNDEDWKKMLRQMDLLETEILAKLEDGSIGKAIVRKTQRLIEQRVSWAVYKRDLYTCRYCGRDGIPLTVDHLVLWEEGGPSIEENLVTACRKCNKTRGNMQYADWLESEKYKRLSAGISPVVEQRNQLLVQNLDNIPRNIHQRSRGKKRK